MLALVRRVLNSKKLPTVPGGCPHIATNIATFLINTLNEVSIASQLTRWALTKKKLSRSDIPSPFPYTIAYQQIPVHSHHSRSRDYIGINIRK